MIYATKPIGDHDDNSGIRYMQVINGQMYAIKENSIWRIQLADETDPERANHGIPNTQQRIASFGASDLSVVRTLIQTISLVKNRSFDDAIEVNQALVAALVACHAMSIVGDNIARLTDHEAQAKSAIRKLDSSKNLVLPNLPDIEILWASSIYSIAKGRSAIRDLVFAFFPENTRGEKWFDDFRTRICFDATRMFENEKALETIDHDLRTIRELRNLEEHPKTGRWIEISDYWMRPDGDIHPPTIRIEGIGEAPHMTQLSGFLSQMRQAVISSFEMVLLWCVGSNVREVLGQRPLEVADGNPS